MLALGLSTPTRFRYPTLTIIVYVPCATLLYTLIAPGSVCFDSRRLTAFLLLDGLLPREFSLFSVHNASASAFISIIHMPEPSSCPSRLTDLLIRPGLRFLTCLLHHRRKNQIKREGIKRVSCCACLDLIYAYCVHEVIHIALTVPWK